MPPASPFFCEHRLERLDVERKIGDDLLQPPIFIFELSQSLRLAVIHSRKLGFPAIERRRSYADSPDDIFHLRAGVGLAKRSDDLLLGESTFRHAFSLWSSFWGQVTINSTGAAAPPLWA